MNSENILRKVYCWGWHTPVGIWRNILRTKYLFKWTYQRFVRGYADCDVWNFDSYLLNVIIGGLKGLAEGHSFPHDFACAEDWEDWLNKTAQVFTEAIIVEKDFGSTIPTVKKDIIKVALTRLGEYFYDLWD